MAYAYCEKLARINLPTGTIPVEKLDTDLAKKFIGGRGLGAKIVYDEGCATADALGPDNKLVYVTGPLTGAGARLLQLRWYLGCQAEVRRLGRSDRGRRSSRVDLHQHR